MSFTGLMSSLRLIGPALGYGLAAICIRMYVNLTEKTTLKPRDPSWIGAWWLGRSTLITNEEKINSLIFCLVSLGFMVIGIVQLSTAWMLACFPRVLPKNPNLSRGISTVSNQTTRTDKSKQRTLKRNICKLFRFPLNVTGFYV